jgi:hypothetical protein
MKVDATYFRALVDLYLYAMDDATAADLYREFFPERKPGKIDYRIFNGQTPTVDFRLVEIMEAKFAAQGLDPDTVRQWIGEHHGASLPDRTPYWKIRPALRYLQEVLGVHPTFLLNQVFGRYESGRLKSVSRSRYEQVLRLQGRVEQLVDEGRTAELASLRDSIYGKKPGYTLFVEVEEALTFLQRYAGAGMKKYLGRSRKLYDQGKVKRIPDRQAERILRDCEAFIRRNPDLPLSVLPSANQKRRIVSLLSVLLLRTTDLLSREEGIVFEKQVLKPRYQKSVYMAEAHGFVQVDMASAALGMKQKAFDLMVAMNCEIFKNIGKYSRRWYLPDQYLEEIRQKEPFGLIKAKYELLAKAGKPPKPPGICLN